MYGLSDPELERQANDKISFWDFLVSEKFPIKRLSGTSGNVCPKRIKIRRSGTNSKDNWTKRDWRSGKVWSRMRHSSRRLRDMQLPILPGRRCKTRRNKEGTGQKRGKSPILDSNFTRKKTVTLDWYGHFRLLLHLFMIVVSICLKKVKWFYRDRGYLVQSRRVLMLPCNEESGSSDWYSGYPQNKRISRIRSPGERPTQSSRMCFMTLMFM